MPVIYVVSRPLIAELMTYRRGLITGVAVAALAVIGGISARHTSGLGHGSLVFTVGNIYVLWVVSAHASVLTLSECRPIAPSVLECRYGGIGVGISAITGVSGVSCFGTGGRGND